MRSLFWRSIFIALVTFWAVYEFYPPTKQDIVAIFNQEAKGKDAAFEKMVSDARAKQQQTGNDLTLEQWQAVIGTNQLTKYFSRPIGRAVTDTNRAILNSLQTEAAGKIKLGLDLRGGTQFMVELAGDPTDMEGARSQAIEVFRKRVDKFGVSEPLILSAAQSRIIIQVPGLSQEDRLSARAQIEKTSFLEFRLVHPDSDRIIASGVPVVPGYELMTEKKSEKNGVDSRREVLVKRQHEMTGENISKARFDRDPMTGKPQIAFSLNSAGAAQFGKLTEANIGKGLAIILDGQLVSAPTIQSRISNEGQITGSFTEKEARELANTLENPLSTPVRIIEERDIDPSLGKDSIEKGFAAAKWGVLLVSVFMLFYYLQSGVVANIGLIFNLVFLLGVLCSVGATLTLPGIAGVVLTVGMAVDANVLINERIRDELASGKSLKGALHAGYDKAFGTIFDSNLTTLIASVILIYMGEGAVKGFGVSLTIGIATSMLSSLVCTRIVFDLLLDRGWFRPTMLQVLPQPNFKIMRYSRGIFCISWVAILATLGFGFSGGESQYLSTDFRGGESLVLGFEQAKKVDVDRLRSTLSNGGIGDVQIQYQKDIASGTEVLAINTPIDAAKNVESILKQSNPDSAFKRLSLTKIGPTLGKEIQKTAVIALLLASFGILVYVAFRYEFSFAVGAIVALMHDVLISTGIFLTFGGQLNSTVIAALLTIIGFSINDTIVIFDRIREVLRNGGRGSFEEIINAALNQTLSRTIITSGTVFLSTATLYLFGGPVIHDFAFVMLVGIITGSYSSIYIASVVVLWWHKGKRPEMAPAASSESIGVTAGA